MMDSSISLQLASQSPRRRELLEQVGISYQLVTAPIDESAKLNESPTELVLRLAESKARAGFERSPTGPTLGADTLVVVDLQVFGKPKDKADCVRMLQALAGREHEVLSAVAITDGQRSLSELSRSKVRFRKISNEEIHRYWETKEPCDKAGAYAIQGKGAVFVESLNGSYSGVMGLPIRETVALLEAFDISVWS